MIVALALVMFHQGLAQDSSPISHGLAWRAVVMRLLMPIVASVLTKALDLGPLGGMGLLLAALAPPAIGALTPGVLIGVQLPNLAAIVSIGTAIAVILLALLVSPISAVLWVFLPYLAGLALRRVMSRYLRAVSLVASVATAALLGAALWYGLQNPLTGPMLDRFAVAAILLMLAGFAGAAIIGRGLTPSDRDALILSTLITVPAIPIAFSGALIIAGVAFPAAIAALAGYGLALLLIVLRRRNSRP